MTARRHRAASSEADAASDAEVFESSARSEPGSSGSEMEAFRRDAGEGLLSRPRRLSSKYFYDEKGSALFEKICELDEYYPTRTELRILESRANEMAERIGRDSVIIEFGSGSSRKTRLLLRALERPVVYVPVDISREHLFSSAARLARSFPGIPVLPVHGDFTGPFPLPPDIGSGRRVVYFPGSTIGNFEPAESLALLARIAALVGPGGGLLVGVDRKKDRARLEAAYNDPAGVTAAFNRNLLERLRRELAAEVDPSGFDHRAFYNEREGRIEMHLVSRGRQTIRLNGVEIVFSPGESIHTENSYKHDPDEFVALCARAGFGQAGFWTDSDALFGVHYLQWSADSPPSESL